MSYLAFFLSLACLVFSREGMSREVGVEEERSQNGPSSGCVAEEEKASRQDDHRDQGNPNFDPNPNPDPNPTSNPNPRKRGRLRALYLDWKKGRLMI